MSSCMRVAALTSCLCFAGVAAAQTPADYSAAWASVDKHPPAPEWFQDAKFGIYFHWGAFSVPAFGSEWYPRNMYNKAGNSAEYQHQSATYGDPFSTWPYNKFLTGANDKQGHFVQFAPKLVSNGGNWDPDAWAQIFVDAGARFAGPVTEHHDGFSMWDSKVNEWNSVALGPKMNLAKLFADAMRKRGLKLLMSQHTAYNFTGYYQYAPAQTDPSLQKLFGQLPKAQEEQLWLGKLKEVIDEFLPDIIWQDFNLAQISETTRLQFLAYYYNAAAAANKEVVATYKDGFDNKGEVYDYERGGPAGLTTPYWLTDDAVSPSSWSYTNGMGYYTPAQEVGSFIDRVSKGGNLLLNISPTWDGTIPQQQLTILSAFGSFLKQMGTAIYETRPWTVYGEGPTKLGGGSFTQPTALTSADIRYTKSKDGDALYAILGGWPGNGKQVNLTSVTTSAFGLGSGKVFLFAPVGGTAIQLQATQDASGLHVTLPSTQPYTAIAYAMKISKSGTAPAPTPTIDVPSGGGAGGSGGAGGGSGSGGAAGSSAGGSSGGMNSAGGVSGSATGGSTASGGAEIGGVSSGGAGASPTSEGATGGTGAIGGSAIALAGSSSVNGAAGTHAGSAGSSSSSATGNENDSSGCSCAFVGNDKAPQRDFSGLFASLLGAALLLMRRRN